MNKKKLTIIICTAIIIILCAVTAILIMPHESSVSVTEMLSTAQKYLIETDYERAIAEFNKVIEIDPMNTEAYLGLAEAYEKNGQHDKAIETLEKGYEATGDDRIKAALEALLSGVDNAEETEVVTVTSVSETETESVESKTDVSEEIILSEENTDEILKRACQIIGMFGTEQKYDEDAVFGIGEPYECGYYKVKDFSSDEYHYVYFKNYAIDDEYRGKMVGNQRVFIRGRLFDFDRSECAYTAYNIDNKVKYNSDDIDYSVNHSSVTDSAMFYVANDYFTAKDNDVYYFEAGGAPGASSEITVRDNKIAEIFIPASEWFSDCMTLRYYYDEDEKSWLICYEYQEDSFAKDIRDSDLPYYALPYDKGIIYPTIEGIPDDFDAAVFDIPENSSGFIE